MNFVILALRRTGSSHLMGALRLHPEIFCHGELFAVNRLQPPTAPSQWKIENETELLALRAADPRAFLARLSAIKFGKPIVGFKMMATHNPEMFDKILADRTIKKIITARENTLARYASQIAAQTSSNFGVTGTKPPVAFDARAFENHLAEDAAFHALVRGTLTAGDQDFHVFQFERINEREAIEAAAHFVGARAELLGMRPPPDNRSNGDVIARFSNPGTVRAYLRDTGLEKWSVERSAFPAL